MTKVENVNSLISESELAAAEAEMKIAIPASYRSFLLQHNGGLPSPDIVDIPGLRESPTDIQIFFGIGARTQACDVIWNFQMYLGRIPADWIPIACDSGGNLFCISAGSTDFGQVFYAAFEPDSITHFFVADSFRAFLKQIRHWGS